MKIEESTITLDGRHRFDSEAKMEISTQASFRMVLNDVSQAAVATEAVPAESHAERLRLMLEKLIAQILALISGEQSPPEVKVSDIAGVGDGAEGGGGGRPVKTFAWHSEYTETRRERESSTFSATGSISTADGRAIEFDLSLSMCRDFQCTNKKIEDGFVQMRDPLVINFDGKAAELASSRFSFDLDVDGQTESLRSLGRGSGFLALDVNGDGRINDGSELFGAGSGNGFADLARLDSDGNHWIDEDDPVFADLRVWRPEPAESSGKGLVSLKDAGVGALYLGSTETPFTLKDESNRTLGQIRASGVYLREDGRAGTLQQIDLAV